MTTAPATPVSQARPRAEAAGASRAARTPHSAPRPSRVGALHRQGDSIRIVVATVDQSGGVTVVDSRTIRASDAGAMTALAADRRIGTLIRVISSSSTIGRCVALPAPPAGAGDRSREELLAALSLVAESELPSSIPPHRRAGGIIRLGPDGSNEAALVVGWPVKEGDAAGPRPGAMQRCASELAALAGLAGLLGGAELAVYADREAGSAAILASGRNGSAGLNGSTSGGGRTSARVLRADTSSDAAFAASVRGAVDEALAAVGADLASLPSVSSEPVQLHLVSAGAERIAGASMDPDWLRQYGIALGAIALAASSDPAARSLASLRALPPDERIGRFRRLLNWAAVPRNAVGLIAACLLMLLLCPLAVAAGRHWVLSERSGGLSALQERLQVAARRAAFYEQLRLKRWPMTKLAADIAGAAPVGVTLDHLALSREQGLTVSGRADSAELVNEFAKNLRDSRVFDGVGTPSVESESSAVKFNLEARVVSPLFPGPRAGDFRTQALAVRLYGDRAAQTAPSDSDTGPSPAASSAQGSREAPASSSGDASERRATRPRTPRDADTTTSGERKPASSDAIPPPLSDADIAKLDRNAALKEWTSRKSAATKDVDADTKRRLLDESEKAKQRYTELNKGGGG
jgi:hypothetical protein